MSLKNFHVLFMVTAIAMTLFCGALAFNSFRADGSSLAGVAAIASIALSALLVRYEKAFLRRCRQAGIR